VDSPLQRLLAFIGASHVSTIQSGTAQTYGWASRTVQGKEGDEFSVKDVLSQSGSAVAGDGVTVDSTGIDAAIAYAAANGKTLVFPAGTYLVGSAAWVGFAVASKNNWGIRGEKGAQIKVSVAPSQTVDGLVSLLKLTSCTDVSITGIDFNLNSKVTGGIGMDTCQNCVISRNKIRDGGVGTIAGVHSVSGVENDYSDNIVTGMGSGGRGLWIGNTSSGQPETFATISRNHVFSNGATGIGGTIQQSAIVNNVIYSNAGSGIALGCANPGVCSDVTITGNYIASNTFHGIQSDVVGAFPSKGITVTGNTVLANLQSGIYVVTAVGWTITGNTVKNNNFDNVGSGYGIQISTATDVAVCGNFITDDQATLTQTECIRVEAQGASDTRNIVISGNHCRNYTFGIRIIPNGNAMDSIAVTGNICDGGIGGQRGITFTSANITKMTVTGNICTNNSVHDIGDGSGTITANTAFGVNNFATGITGILPFRVGLKVWTYGTTAPTAGTWAVGDRCINTSATVGLVQAWKCVVAGTPGTWVPEGMVVGVGADNGDAIKTLTAGTDATTQRWATALGSNRAVTLATSGVWNGAKFHIVRTAASTGASTLDVGTGPLKSLAVGPVVRCRVDERRKRMARLPPMPNLTVLPWLVWGVIVGLVIAALFYSVQAARRPAVQHDSRWRHHHAHGRALRGCGDHEPAVPGDVGREGQAFEGCWAPHRELQVVIAYFDDKTVALIPIQAFVKVVGA
jgi:parallel beta-helix repeat protein